jgi:hypothetical protein
MGLGVEQAHNFLQIICACSQIQRSQVLENNNLKVP